MRLRRSRRRSTEADGTSVEAFLGHCRWGFGHVDSVRYCHRVLRTNKRVDFCKHVWDGGAQPPSNATGLARLSWRLSRWDQTLHHSKESPSLRARGLICVLYEISESDWGWAVEIVGHYEQGGRARHGIKRGEAKFDLLMWYRSQRRLVARVCIASRGKQGEEVCIIFQSFPPRQITDFLVYTLLLSSAFSLFFPSSPRPGLRRQGGGNGSRLFEKGKTGDALYCSKRGVMTTP